MSEEKKPKETRKSKEEKKPEAPFDGGEVGTEPLVKGTLSDSQLRARITDVKARLATQISAIDEDVAKRKKAFTDAQREALAKFREELQIESRERKAIKRRATENIVKTMEATLKAHEEARKEQEKKVEEAKKTLAEAEAAGAV